MDSQTGTQKNPVDWSTPDEWIPERLTGEPRELALEIWRQSGHTINPRYVYGIHYFCYDHRLIKPDETDVYRWTDAGRAFMNEDPTVLRAIDEAEGMLYILPLLARHSPATRRELLDEWGEFALAHSKFTKPSTFWDTLRRRMHALVERGFIHREGTTYTITDSGIAYAASSETAAQEQPYQAVIRAIKTYNDTQVQALRERLGKMHPYRFESLVKDLLDAMDYEDVEVTKQSGDKGIDVVAYFQFGITRIKEVVQVKRHQGSITRPVLDQLRGALPYHQAIRGTIITLGKFARGCEEAALYPGAAPITLIDGDMLIDLLLKHNVGIRERKQTLIEMDEDYFARHESPGDPASGAAAWNPANPEEETE